MIKTTMEVFDKYQVRKTKKQKRAFMEYVKSVALENGYSFKVEKGSFGVRNLVVGDPDGAKVVYGAHYDTCARLPVPNFITPKNFLIYLLYTVLIGVAFFLFMEVVIFFLDMCSVTTDVRNNIICLLGLLLSYLIIAGPANKHTANDNTSGVTTLLDIMTSIPEGNREKAAFVFFDLEEAGLFGSSAFASKHRKVMKSTLLVNFDCVSDGEHILFMLKKKARAYKDMITKAFEEDEHVNVEVATKGVFYPSDQMNFPLGVGVAALKKSRFFNVLYMNRIHTEKDTVYREENIAFLKNGAIKLLDMV